MGGDSGVQSDEKNPAKKLNKTVTFSNNMDDIMAINKHQQQIVKKSGPQIFIQFYINFTMYLINLQKYEQ